MIHKLRQRILIELGPEVLIEACGVIGLFECFTKFVDATGKQPNPFIIQNMMTIIFGIRNIITKIMLWLLSSFYTLFILPLKSVVINDSVHTKAYNSKDE